MNATSPGLDVSHVDVSFPRPDGTSHPVLNGLDLRLPAGRFLVVIGPNGAGKSTLVNVISGALRPTAGTVHIAGNDVTHLAESRRSRYVGRVFQDPRAGTCADLSVKENLALAAGRGRARSWWRPAVTRSRAQTYVELLAEYGRGLSLRLDQKVGELSGGQRQVISLVMAVAARPVLLLLDEHTSALDPEMAELVTERTVELADELDLTTVMITHNMQQAAAVGDALAMLHGGRIVEHIDGKEHTRMSEQQLVQLFRDVTNDTHAEWAL